MISKVESIIDAIAQLNGAFSNPESQAYKLRNPLMVRSFARPGKHESTATGHRVFTSVLAGYRAAVFDISLKLEGRSRAGIKVTDTLANLLRVYDVKDGLGMDKAVSFIKRALDDPSISRDTPLEFFREERN